MSMTERAPILRRLVVLAAVAALSAPGLGRAATSPVPGFSSTLLPKGGGEPNVSVSPSGRTILVDGLADTSPASLYRSTDSGASFTRITPTFSSSGGGDWDMRFLDERNVIAADLGGGGILVHRSADAGSTWETTLVFGDFYDRPWIDHDGAKKVYLVAKGFDGVPYLYTSTDGGASFGTPPIPVLVYGNGTTPAVAGGKSPTAVELAYGSAGAYVDHLTVDQRTHDVYVLYGLAGEDAVLAHPPSGVSSRLYVAHLENGAFVSRLVYRGNGATESFISGFNWMTVDTAGTVYVLANGTSGVHHSIRLSYSKNHGRSWSKLVDLGRRGAANVYGAIAGGARGVLSLVYLRGSEEDPSSKQDWYAEVARVTGANTARPLVYRTRPLAEPVHTTTICFDGIACDAPGGGDRALLDYIWNAVTPTGHAIAVIASDGPASGGAKNRVSVIVLRQISGASHGRGVAS